MSDTPPPMATDTPVDELPGHIFLARMGKKLLRPGGRRGTEQLFTLAGLRPGERVCEIATNRAITAIELVRRFDVNVDGVDMSVDFLSIAKENVAAHALQDRIRLHVGNGHELPFDDGTFDVVIAEAVITMLPPARKADTLNEATRVLKPGGRLVFHELSRTDDAAEELRRGLVKTIRHAAWPLTLSEWTQLVEQVGLRETNVETGPMSLMSARGLLRDEGFGGVARILGNVLRTPGAAARFRGMASFFRRHRSMLRYIVLRADKVRNGAGKT